LIHFYKRNTNKNVRCCFKYVMIWRTAGFKMNRQQIEQPSVEE